MSKMGYINKIIAKSGEREAVLAFVRAGSEAMEGCLSYIVAADAENENTIWVSEVWMSEAHHQASLLRPHTRAAIAQAMPLIESFEAVAKTRPH